MKIFNKIYIGLIFLFLYAPIFVLIAFSFNNSKSRIVWSGWTFKWYEKLFSNQEIFSAFYNTLIVATVAAIVATVLGTVAAVGIMKTRKWQKQIIMNITNLPMINPEIVTGVSMMLLFVFLYNKFGILKPGLLTLIFAHITFCLPYVILSVMPKLRQMDPHIHEAAQDLGCSPLQSFFKVVLPQITPGIITGLIMSFTMSIDDFVISYFAGGSVQTLPIAVFAMTRKIVSPEINALSTLLFVVVFALLIVINLRQENEKRIKDKN